MGDPRDYIPDWTELPIPEYEEFESVCDDLDELQYEEIRWDKKELKK